jgi:hypothetical protein
MDKNLALQEKAGGGDPVSIEVLRSMHPEAQRELEAIAQAKFPSNSNDFLFEMQVYVQEDKEDPPLGDSGPGNQDDVQKDVEVSPLGASKVEDVLPAWQEYLPI